VMCAVGCGDRLRLLACGAHGPLHTRIEHVRFRADRR